jgi:hypothetical protein
MRDSELILGLGRHLGAYALGPARAALAQLEFAGHVFETAWRLRGSGASGGPRIVAIGQEAGIGHRQLVREILPVLSTLGWLDFDLNSEGSLLRVDERIPPPRDLVALADSILAIANPTSLELAALNILRDTTAQPLVEQVAISSVTSQSSEEDAREAIRHLIAIGLTRRVTTDDGKSVLFNPNIWVGDAGIIRAALKTEDDRIRLEVGSLIEEVSQSPGIPETQVSSTDKRWIDFAVSHGLIQRSLVVTTEGNEKAFLFTPHLGRDPFGVSHGDPSGHVRQLVGSMIYAATFSRFKLKNPAVFIRALLRDGEAGDASPIGTDYPMLETAGIVRVEPGSRYYKFVLLQADVAEEALGYLTDSGTQGSLETGALRAQRSYVHLEKERARLALTVPVDDVETERLISALRDTAARRSFRGR